MNTNYTTTKGEALAEIVIAVMATITLFACWGKEGWLFNAGLVWAGIQLGYLITIYMDAEGDDE